MKKFKKNHKVRFNNFIYFNPVKNKWCRKLQIEKLKPCSKKSMGWYWKSVFEISITLWNQKRDFVGDAIKKVVGGK